MLFFEKLNTLPRLQKQIITIILDIACITFAILSAFALLTSSPMNSLISSFIALSADSHLPLIVLAIITAIPVFIRFGLYNAVLRYVGAKAYWTIVLASALSIALWVLAYSISTIRVPVAVPVITFLILVLLLGTSRALAKSIFLVKKKKKSLHAKKVVIYGANNAGSQLALALSHDQNIQLIGFIDDDSSLHGKTINGKKIYSLKQTCDHLLAKPHKKIDEILLAIPSDQKKRSKIIDTLTPYPIKVRTLPSLLDLTQGKVTVDSIRELDLEDLLGRKPVEPIQKLIEANIKSRNIMITGAGGSIGSELCRQIILHQPQLIVLYELSEFALYQIEKELLSIIHAKNLQLPIIPVLGNVTNQKRVERTCKTFGINTIYHAAAYKHVPMVEKNIAEGVSNNILGTYHCAQAAINTKVDTFVLISTDKAVRPTNTMGATKRFAELILQTLSDNKPKPHNTRFTMVRFGNVLGSSGSVIPLFRDQIKNGGPVTITDKNIERYFMTIPEASQLVIQAGAMGKGGDVFVLDMGKPVRIIDLAKRMIKLSGFEVADSSQKEQESISIIYTGLRPGEKISEELLIGTNTSKTLHPLIMRAHEETITYKRLQTYLDALRQGIANEDEEHLRQVLLNVVSGYKPQCEVVDVLLPQIQAEQVS